MKLALGKLEGWGYCMVKFCDPSFNHIWDIGCLKAESPNFLPTVTNSGQGAVKVIHFGTNGKRVYTFLLVINNNFSHILHRFGDMAT